MDVITYPRPNSGYTMLAKWATGAPFTNMDSF